MSTSQKTHLKNKEGNKGILAFLTEHVTAYREVLLFPSLPPSWSTETVTGMMRLSNEIRRQAAMIGYINAFYLLAFTAAAAVPLAFLLRTVPDRKPG